MEKPAYMTSKTSAREAKYQSAKATQGAVHALAALVLLAGWLACPRPLLCQQAGGLLDLSVLPVEPRQAISLQDALAELGSSVRQGFVLFGLEEKLSEGKEPMVDLRINANTTLGTVLREILSQLPAYEMEVVSDHLIDLRPKGSRDDPDNVLNLRVPSFDVVSKPAYLILEAPRRVIPELDNVLRPKPKPGEQVVELYVGGMHGGPLVTLHIANVTIRDIFNATSVATEPSFADHNANAPRGWFFTFDPSPPAGKSKYNWQTFFALPGDWHYGTREVPKPPSN